jgi:hypothetical protein
MREARNERYNGGVTVEPVDLLPGGVLVRSRNFTLLTILAAGLVTFVSTARGDTISGTLGAAYGPPLAVQTSQSNVGGTGNPAEPANTNGGSQLDAAYGYISGGTLYLFFSGNLTFWLQLEGYITHWLPLDVFIDCAPGGQRQLLSNNPAITPGFYDLTLAAGLTFDTAFDADYWLSVGGSVVEPPWPQMNAYLATLPSGGGGSGVYLGGTTSGAPGVLSGGVNPDGIRIAFNDDNRLGLGSGCGPASQVAVETGIEFAIPLSAIGNPTGCIRVCAFVTGQDPSMISNQVMGPIPPGTCSLTPAASTDFSAVPGDQFFTVCPQATAARHRSWGTLKTLYR